MTNPNSKADAVEALAGLYHSWITGLVLTILNRRDASLAEEFVFQLFRRQHLQRFLPGLEKLGVGDEPHAIWLGTALCAIPTQVNRAMLRGWHAHNGVTLGNPNLGFVCTKTTVDGQPGLEGYYREFPTPLDAHERLRFSPGETCPYINPADLPVLDLNAWPQERRAKAYRNYSMEYIRNALPVLMKPYPPPGSPSGKDYCRHTIGFSPSRSPLKVRVFAGKSSKAPDSTNSYPPSMRCRKCTSESASSGSRNGS